MRTRALAEPREDQGTLPGGASSSRRNGYLPFAPPLIGEEEIAEVVATLRSEWITTGPKVARFEAEFAGCAPPLFATIALFRCCAEGRGSSHERIS